MCPCGSGKKIKFCCSNDLLPEIDRIERLLESKQFNAAADLVDQVMASKGRRPALLSFKSQIQLKVNPDGAIETVKEWLERSPRNTLALSVAAQACARRGDLAGAIERYSRGFELADKLLDAQYLMLFAGRMIANLLLRDNDLMGAHFYLATAVEHTERSGAPEDSNDEREALGRLIRQTEVPAVAKQLHELRDCPETVVWRDDFRAAKALAEKNAAWKACEAFEALASRFSSQPSILRNLAVLRLRLGNRHLSSLAWRTYAALPSISAEEAFEALLTAEYLEPVNPDTVDVISQTIKLSETDRVIERLLSDRRCLANRGVVENWDVESDGPAPKAAFIIADRPCRDLPPATTFTELPVVVGRIQVFGRQTDRAPRIELLARTPDNLPAFQERMREVCGDSLVEMEPIEVIGDEPLLLAITQPEVLVIASKARYSNSEAKERLRIKGDYIRNNLLEVWATKPLKSLDGKTPIEAARDPGLARRLSVLISLFEQVDYNRDLPTLFDELRARVGLPAEPSLHGPDIDVAKLPLFRLKCVDVKSLTDDQLAQLTVRTHDFDVMPAKLAAAAEVVARPGFARNPVRIVALHTMLANTETWSDAEVFVEQIIAELAAMNSPPSMGQLLKLQVAVSMGKAQLASQLITTMQREYAADEMVRRQIFNVIIPYLDRLPDGRSVLRLPNFGDSEAAPTAQSAAAKPSGLWTPDQGPPPASIAVGGSLPPTGPTTAAPAAGKSKLWIPGMD